MDKILLFPHGCRKIGWGLFIPAALLGVLMLFDGLNGFPSFLLPGAAEAGETLDAVCNNAVIVDCSPERFSSPARANGSKTKGSAASASMRCSRHSTRTARPSPPRRSSRTGPHFWTS